MFSHKASAKNFFKSLWHPGQNLFIYENKKVIVLIIGVAVFFGLAHIISGEPWSNGKFVQATAAGIILGWVYYRFGLISAILIHWATNYFLYAYANMISQINLISVQDSFSHSMFDTMELILVITGLLSIAILILDRINSTRTPRLEV